MTLGLTLLLSAILLAVALGCGWLGARPPNLAKGPRMIPYRGIMALSASLLLILLVHIVNLLGVQTGR